MENTDSKVERPEYDSDEVVVEELEVEPKYHNFFFDRNAQLIKKIAKENGGVYIGFPFLGSNLSKVWLKGAKSFVDTARSVP